MIAERQVVGEVTAKLCKFGPGPWLDEPDQVEWTAHGMACMVRRHPDFGSLLGFVGTTAARVAQVDLDRLQVHGGVECVGPLDAAYRPLLVKAEVWLMFASGHFLDVVPWLLKIRPAIYDVANEQGRPKRDARAAYRDVHFMRAECERLALQLARVAL